MRLFFLLLLLGNAAYFTWQYQTGGFSPAAAPEAPVTRSDPGVPALTLLAERGQRADTPARAETPPAAPPAPATPAPPPIVAPAPPPAPATAAVPPARVRCVVAGPYATRAEAGAGAAAARRAGVTATIEETTRTVTSGYWVMLEGRYPIAEARRLLREMQDRGLRDIAITPLEGGDFVISLGVYSQQPTLEDRRREILANGYVPEVRERERTEPALQLRLALEAADLAPMGALLDTLVREDPRIEWRDVDCR